MADVPLVAQCLTSLSEDLTIADDILVGEANTRVKEALGENKLSPVEIQEAASKSDLIDEDALLLALVAFHHSVKHPNGLKGCAYNVCALLLSLGPFLPSDLEPSPSKTALKFLSHHLRHVSPDDPVAWGVFNSVFKELLADDSISALRELINVYSNEESDASKRGLTRANHLLSILTATGESQRTADLTYVETVFDDLAPSFEEHLVKNLSYVVPSLMRKCCEGLLSEGGANKFVDLGCGTGLVGHEFYTLFIGSEDVPAPTPSKKHEDIIMIADIKEISHKIAKLKESNAEMLEHDPKDEDLILARRENLEIIEMRTDEVVAMMTKQSLLKSKGHHLTGCDVSGKMCDIARARRQDPTTISPLVYDEIVKDDCTSFVRNQAPRSLSAVLAADTFIYVGELDDLFKAAGAAINVGGVFAFSIETCESDDYNLLPTGRYAQSSEYVERLLETNGFAVEQKMDVVLRKEMNVDVAGLVYACRLDEEKGGMML